jgi:replicative DNA helicase
MNITTKESLEYTVLGSIITNQSLYLDNESQVYEGLFGAKNRNLANYIFEELGRGEKVQMVKMAVDTKIDYETINRIVSFSDLKAFSETLDRLTGVCEGENLQRLIAVAKNDLNNGMDSQTVFNSITAGMDGVKNRNKNYDDYHIRANLNDTLDRIVKAKDIEGITGFDTGIESLNNITGGYHKGQQVIIAARPGMGKSTWLFNEIKVACQGGFKCALFNLEMTTHEVNLNLMALVAGISVQDLRNGDVSDQQIKELIAAIEKIAEWNLWVFDSINDMDEIVTEFRILNRKFDIDYFCLDYLQLCQSKKRGSREEIVSDMSRRFKLMTKPGDCDCVNLILSQLSRAVESRGGDKRPILSDLRESGAIEQDADVIQFLFRPSYYGLDQMGDVEDVTEIIVAKNRGGSGITETIEVVFNKFGFKDAYLGFSNQGLEPFPSSELPYKMKPNQNPSGMF